jgi:hypothetical protein
MRGVEKRGKKGVPAKSIFGSAAFTLFTARTHKEKRKLRSNYSAYRSNFKEKKSKGNCLVRIT